MKLHKTIKKLDNLNIRNIEKIIKDLEAQLEDDAYQEDWVKIHDELMYRENQMKEIIRNEKTT